MSLDWGDGPQKLPAMRVLYVPLPSEAFEILSRLAARELRHPRQQAARLILDGLRREAEATGTGGPRQSGTWPNKPLGCRASDVGSDDARS